MNRIETNDFVYNVLSRKEQYADSLIYVFRIINAKKRSRYVSLSTFVAMQPIRNTFLDLCLVSPFLHHTSFRFVC